MCKTIRRTGISVFILMRTVDEFRVFILFHFILRAQFAFHGFPRASRILEIPDLWLSSGLRIFRKNPS